MHGKIFNKENLATMALIILVIAYIVSLTLTAAYWLGKDLERWLLEAMLIFVHSLVFILVILGSSGDEENTEGN